LILKEGQSLRIGKKVYRIIKEYLDFYLAVRHYQKNNKSV